MAEYIEVAGRRVGDGYPVFVIAEIGLNHNGDLALAKRLIDVAAACGCDAVKFQKRDPELCVPPDLRDHMRETPWGYISYMDYRYRVEFQQPEYDEIDRYCKEREILWTASCWDVNSVEFVGRYEVPFHKVASALITHRDVLAGLTGDGAPVIASTGMSTMEEIDGLVAVLREATDRFALLHCTSTYPCPPEELNLRMIPALRERFAVPVGYSGHEVGLAPSWAAVALGASIVERHITLDRSMWGSDQAASVEPGGLERLVRDIRTIERAMGDGVKRLYESEEAIRRKLRAV